MHDSQSKATCGRQVFSEHAGTLEVGVNFRKDLTCPASLHARNQQAARGRPHRAPAEWCGASRLHRRVVPPAGGLRLDIGHFKWSKGRINIRKHEYIYRAGELCYKFKV